MKRARWACCSRWLALAALVLATSLAALPAWAGTALVPDRAQVLDGEADAAPAPDDPRWRDTQPGRPRPGGAAWYRVRFDVAAPPAEFWAVYLPYLYAGGRVWLNGVPVAEVPQSSATLRVRWERPHLLPLPPAALRVGANELLLWAASNEPAFGTVLPRLEVGPQSALQPDYDRRHFMARTLPMVTVLGGCVVGAMVLLIWWRRRVEVLYGLFGLAVLMWALRTTTFVFDHVPVALYPALRLLYFTSTGGFVVVMALFALAMAGWSRPAVTRVLLGYWALGPLVFLLGGEQPTARGWVAGLALVGIALGAVVFTAAWRQRSVTAVSVAAVLALAVVAGLHDHLLATNAPFFLAALPDWSVARYFLLHHAANGLLLTMGLLLVLRFAGALSGLEEANRTLEARVQAREREIAASYERIAALQREQAATEERQRIMRDLHDGLGAQLFTSLSRAERGMLDTQAMSDTLRGAIDQMRVAIEALASQEQDFRTAFGNFRFRWDTRLREAGLATQWQVDLPDEPLALAPHDALQVLHIAQEALTNVLKHAQARQVTVQLQRQEQALLLAVADDGRGLPGADAPAAGAAVARAAGRGQANMRTRALRLAGTLDIGAGPRGGTQVRLRLPLRAAS